MKRCYVRKSGCAVRVSVRHRADFDMKLHRMFVTQQQVALFNETLVCRSSRLEFPENATLKLIVQHRHRGGQMRARTGASAARRPKQ